jgi:hypothetical protein
VDTLFHYRQAINLGNIESVCIEAVNGHPNVPMILFPMKGDRWLIDLIDELKGHKIEARFKEVMTLMYQQASAKEMEVLSSVAEYRPEVIQDEQILILLERIPEMSDNSKSSLSRALCVALLDRGLIYDTRIRSFASQQCSREWLASAYVSLDHSWTLASLGSWFSGDGVKDETLLRRMCMRLTLGELIEFEKEIKDLPFQSTTKRIIFDYFTQVTTLKTFTDRGLSINWR